MPMPMQMIVKCKPAADLKLDAGCTLEHLGTTDKFDFCGT